jgi:hypothetical protein
VPALGPHLRGHRGSGTTPGSQNLTFGLMTEQLEYRLVRGVDQVHWPVELGQPRADVVGVELGDDAARLAGGERALELADHHRIEPPLRVGGRGQQRGRLWAVLPRQGAGVADIEELDHDPAAAVDHPDCVAPLSFLRRSGILETPGRGTPVEGEP